MWFRFRNAMRIWVSAIMALHIILQMNRKRDKIYMYHLCEPQLRNLYLTKMEAPPGYYTAKLVWRTGRTSTTYGFNYCRCILFFHLAYSRRWATAATLGQDVPLQTSSINFGRRAFPWRQTNLCLPNCCKFGTKWKQKDVETRTHLN